MYSLYNVCILIVAINLLSTLFSMYVDYSYTYMYMYICIYHNCHVLISIQHYSADSQPAACNPCNLHFQYKYSTCTQVFPLHTNEPIQHPVLVDSIFLLKYFYTRKPLQA